MATKKSTKTAHRKRQPLTKQRVLQTALRLADERGVESLSMRRLATELGVEAMSLYNHIANKDQMLDGMVELVMSEIYAPQAKDDWRDELRRRGNSMHVALLRHPWAAPLMESRASGSVQLTQHNAVLACLRQAGFSIPMAHRALLTLDSYLYGFAFQQTAWPYDSQQLPDVVERMLPRVSTQAYPYVVELMQYVQEKKQQKTAAPEATDQKLDFQEEFEFGLELILSSFQQLLER